MTGVVNSLGQDGGFKASNLPIKNRVNALDVSTKMNRLAYKDMKGIYYYTASLGYYGIQMGGTIIVTDASTIFDFASAIAITALAFVFPGLFYLKAEEKFLGDKP